MKKNHEDYIQIYVVSFLKKLQLSGADFMFWHTPNQGRTSAQMGNKFKLMGVLSGVPDLAFMAKDKFHFIEMKKIDGKLSPMQKDFIAKAKSYGFGVSVIYTDTIQSAIEQIGKIMQNIFLIDHQAISQSSLAVISSLPVSENRLS